MSSILEKMLANCKEAGYEPTENIIQEVLLASKDVKEEI